MTVAKALEIIIMERGKDILKSSNMVQSMIMDYVTGYDNEKKLFRVGCQHGILNYAYDILISNDGVQRKLLANKAKKWLETEAFLSEENAIIAVNIILEAMNMEFQLKNERVKKFKNNVEDFLIDDIKKAEEYFKKGDAYYHGVGVELDREAGAKWYRQAAEWGM